MYMYIDGLKKVQGPKHSILDLNIIVAVLRLSALQNIGILNDNVVLKLYHVIKW